MLQDHNKHKWKARMAGGWFWENIKHFLAIKKDALWWSQIIPSRVFRGFRQSGFKAVTPHTFCKDQESGSELVTHENRTYFSSIILFLHSIFHAIECTKIRMGNPGVGLPCLLFPSASWKFPMFITWKRKGRKQSYLSNALS